jgi:hypothetical protein
MAGVRTVRLIGWLVIILGVHTSIHYSLSTRKQVLMSNTQTPRIMLLLRVQFVIIHKLLIQKQIVCTTSSTAQVFVLVPDSVACCSMGRAHLNSATRRNDRMFSGRR